MALYNYHIEYDAMLSSQAKAFPFVLNTPAQEILDFFSEPRRSSRMVSKQLIDYHDAQNAIAQFYEVGLLQEASVEHEITKFQPYRIAPGDLAVPNPRLQSRLRALLCQ